jgi:hypothetical protein
MYNGRQVYHLKNLKTTAEMKRPHITSEEVLFITSWQLLQLSLPLPRCPPMTLSSYPFIIGTEQREKIQAQHRPQARLDEIGSFCSN